MKNKYKNTVDEHSAIRCEGIAIRHFGNDVSDEKLQQEAKTISWTSEAGVPLHRVGYLSSAHGLCVRHRYENSTDDILEELKSGSVVIAAVNGYFLSGDAAHYKISEVDANANHVVIINGLADEMITITDPISDNSQDIYHFSLFMDAWSDSSCYLITISDNSEYKPHPVCLDDVDVEDELEELQEALAENAHEVWAQSRQDNGWTYGAVRDDDRKQHPDMVPYNLLSEPEKEYDRLMAINTIKLVKKLGWTFTKANNMKKRHSVTMRQNIGCFSDTECRAIVTLSMKVITSDQQLSAKELASRRELFTELGISFDQEKHPLSYTQALNVLKSMDGRKQETVIDTLSKFAYSDGDVAGKEKQLLDDIQRSMD